MMAIGLAVEAMGFVKGAYSILAMKFHLFAAGMLIAASVRAEGRMRIACGWQLRCHLRPARRRPSDLHRR